MSAREQLQREASLLPEGVVQHLLDYLHGLPATKKSEAPSKGDYFESYWSRWYGSCEGQSWDEPPELPVEIREVW